MPSSTPERQARMERWFGDPVQDTGPIAFLLSRGYKLTPAREWKAPACFHTVEYEEFECIMFLIQEWDFGGLDDTHVGMMKGTP